MRTSPAVPTPKAPDAMSPTQPARQALSPTARAAVRRMTMLPEDAEAAIRLRVRDEPDLENESAFTGATFGRPGHG